MVDPGLLMEFPEKDRERMEFLPETRDTSHRISTPYIPLPIHQVSSTAFM